MPRANASSPCDADRVAIARGAYPRIGRRAIVVGVPPCSFCQLASRRVVFEADNVSTCTECARSVARRVSALSDAALRDLWQIAPPTAIESLARDPRTSGALYSVLEDFRRSVAETVPESDAATHFDLAVAYGEIGLLEEALAELDVARKSIASERLEEIDVRRARLLDAAGEHVAALRVAASVLGSDTGFAPLLVEILFRLLPTSSVARFRELIFVT